MFETTGLGYDHLHGYNLEVFPWSWRPLGLETLNPFLRIFHELRSLNLPAASLHIHVIWDISKEKNHICSYWQIRRAKRRPMNIIKSWNNSIYRNKTHIAFIKVLAACAVAPSRWNHKLCLLIRLLLSSDPIKLLVMFMLFNDLS